MTTRSTRNKIRHQADAAAKSVERAVEHLARIEITASGRSDRIDDTLPKLVVILEGVHNMLVQWRATL